MSARRLASDFSFLKGFAQASFVRPLAPRLFWAHAYRVGLAHVLDDEPLFSSERFTAGGANTVRGFPTDSLGPRTALGDPAGGQAVVVINQELRWDARWGLGAVAFYDGGNVFASVRDVGIDVRHVLGTGLRWRSPVGVVRFDVGFPLAREAGEKKYRLFFSLGQAF
jgi:translocation and assembly module TamA